MKLKKILYLFVEPLILWDSPFKLFRKPCWEFLWHQSCDVHCRKSNPNFRDKTWNVHSWKHESKVLEIFRVVARFTRYISCYIAENRFPLGQCALRTFALYCQQQVIDSTLDFSAQRNFKVLTIKQLFCAFNFTKMLQVGVLI